MGSCTDYRPARIHLSRHTLTSRILGPKPSSLLRALYMLLTSLLVLPGERVLAASAPNYTVAVFARLTCDDVDGDRTTEAWITEAFRSPLQSQTSFRITPHLVDICQTPSWMARLLEASSGNSWAHALIGPGSADLCATSAWLASYSNRPMVSYNCFGSDLSHRQHFPSFRRTVPDNNMSGKALSKILYHFLWKRVAIFHLPSYPWRDTAYDIHRILSLNGFDVTTLVALPGNLTVAEAAQVISASVSGDTKVIVGCIGQSEAMPFLLGAHDAGLTTGDHAIFIIDHTGHFISEQWVSAFLDNSANDTSDAGEQAVLTALQSLFILSSTPYHSVNITNLTDEEVQQGPVSSNLFNAIRMLTSAIYRTEQHGGDPRSGQVVAASTSSQTFDGSLGTVTTDDSGVVYFVFNLYDFDGKDRFLAVLQVPRPSWNLTSVASILWPGGVVLAADTCDFIDCTTGGISTGVIVAIVVVSGLLVTAAISVAIFVRRRMILKELERGPNKILLTTDDLTFVSPKSVSKNSRSFKSNSLFDKPDLLKTSQPSLSLHSFNEFGEYSDVARYNGDMVYVKELRIKGFEMKGKVRNFLKQLRDLRHENINSFLGCFTDPLRPSIVSEFCSRKSLEDVLSNETIKLDWDFKLSLMTDLVRGMRYLHGSPIRAHGNLKSGNCVIDSRWVLKITDYGLAGMYERYQTKRERKPKELLWTAPELLRDEELLHKGSPKGDVYSFAIILQEIIIRGHPFCMLDLNPEEIIKKIRKPPPLCRPSVSKAAAPPSYIQIMKQCWSEMPDMRPDFDSINQQFKDLNKGRKVNVVDTMFKMLEKYSDDLEEIVRERTVELEEEKKKTENLLTQMLPPTVAQSLMTGKPVEAEAFPEVTIYFSDIVGFTTISAMSTPMQVVDLLNDLYTLFDGTIDNHDVYKVETIGDAYMVVSGLPVPNGNRHAGEVASMALDLLVHCAQFRMRHMPDIPMMLRIGLHTGPCVAGVVGLRMPRYCLFGDTVNTASRMESTGLAYRIHLSGETKAVLDELGGYKLECRGEVELKGKGLAKTYWLVGKEGFTKKLPTPPESSGLKAYIDQDKLKKAAEEAKEYNDKNGQTGENGENTGSSGDVSTRNNNDEQKASSGNDAKPASDGGQTTVVAEINHVDSHGDGNKNTDGTLKTACLKTQDIKNSAKLGDEITPVETAAT